MKKLCCTRQPRLVLALPQSSMYVTLKLTVLSGSRRILANQAYFGERSKTGWRCLMKFVNCSKYKGLSLSLLSASLLSNLTASEPVLK